MRAGEVGAAPIVREEPARAPVRSREEELIRGATHELGLGHDLEKSPLLRCFHSGLRVAAESTVRATRESESLEEPDIELRAVESWGHAAPDAVDSRTVLIPGASPSPMVLVAKDIMEKTVLTVDEGVDALTCARTMAQQHKGYAILVKPSGTLAGIVTEWDYLSKIVAPGLDPAKVGVREIATSVVDSCPPDTPTDVVVTSMSEKGIRRMVVRSGDQVLGIITARTVLRMFREYVDKVSSEIAGYQPTQTTLG
jgi:CBS domain-containing protein